MIINDCWHKSKEKCLWKVSGGLREEEGEERRVGLPYQSLYFAPGKVFQGFYETFGEIAKSTSWFFAVGQ